MEQCDLIGCPLDAELTPEAVLAQFIYDRKTGVLYYRFGKQGCQRYAEAGCVDSSGYRQIMIGPRSYQRSRLVFLIETGRWPEPTVDHINRDRLDDRFSNLREASYREQLLNRKAYGAVPWRGVSERQGRYRVQLPIGPFQRHLGYYDHPSIASGIFRSVCYGLKIREWGDSPEPLL